jgi:hypothetical protein
MGGDVHLTVVDTGFGIAREDQKRIWDTLRQVGPGSAKKRTNLRPAISAAVSGRGDLAELLVAGEAADQAQVLVAAQFRGGFGLDPLRLTCAVVE